MTSVEERLVFARRLGELRRRKGLSMQELARRSGLSLSHTYRLEAGSMLPRVDTVVALAQALGVGPGSLFRSDARTDGSRINSRSRKKDNA